MHILQILLFAACLFVFETKKCVMSLVCNQITDEPIFDSAGKRNMFLRNNSIILERVNNRKQIMEKRILSIIIQISGPEAKRHVVHKIAYFFTTIQMLRD